MIRRQDLWCIDAMWTLRVRCSNVRRKRLLSEVSSRFSVTKASSKSDVHFELGRKASTHSIKQGRPAAQSMALSIRRVDPSFSTPCRFQLFIHSNGHSVARDNKLIKHKDQQEQDWWPTILNKPSLLFIRTPTAVFHSDFC